MGGVHRLRHARMENIQYYFGVATIVRTILNDIFFFSYDTPRAILTILQISGAANDPVTRYTALFSLMCALMSLLFGCIYIIRFGSMRKTYKAAEWALVSH